MIMCLSEHKGVLRRLLCAFLLVSLCGVSFSGCQSNSASSESSGFDSIRIVIEDATPQGALLRFENDYGTLAYYGSGFLLWILNGEEWQLVPLKEGVGFHRLLLAAFKREGERGDINFCLENYIDFDFYFDGLEPGEYRFGLDFCLMPQPSEFRTLFAEFEIV